MAGYIGKAAAAVVNGASTTALRVMFAEATVACVAVSATNKAAKAGHYAWRHTKSCVRRKRLECAVAGVSGVYLSYNSIATIESRTAYAMVIRAPDKKFFTIIVESSHQKTVMEDGDDDNENPARVIAVRIRIVEGEVEKAKLLVEELPVVWMHDGEKSHYAGKDSDDVDQKLPFFEDAVREQEKKYLGMSQDPKSPDTNRIDAVEVPPLGRFKSGTVMLDRQGDESQLVILPHNAVDDAETYRGCAAVKATSAMGPDKGIAIKLPMFWKLPVLSAQ